MSVPNVDAAFREAVAAQVRAAIERKLGPLAEFKRQLLAPLESSERPAAVTSARTPVARGKPVAAPPRRKRRTRAPAKKQSAGRAARKKPGRRSRRQPKRPGRRRPRG